jgi:hypothetical protein
MPKKQSPEELSTGRLARSWRHSSETLKAAKIEEPSELWGLESWLTKRRREIDRRYDYRYTVLPLVFAHLLRDGRLTEDDRHGLGQGKLDLIRRASAL